MSTDIHKLLLAEISALAIESIGQEIKLKYDNKILEDGTLDSPSVIKLVLFIEKKYKITIEQDELDIDNFGSINQIVKFITNKKG
tara:strand:+ start:211 stop:465 length:255 start_codon:yes stop_codon:yes gene_type:complete